jgi:hypothetical protein
MTERGLTATADRYAPQRRTAILLSGTGTAGAYHAGALRALHEASVKIDVAAGRGIGAVGALFAAVDGAERLWDENGFWRSGSVRHLYPWQQTVRLLAGACAAAVAFVMVPLALTAAGLIVLPLDFVLKMSGAATIAPLAEWYLTFVRAALAPDALPTWLPRLVVLVLGFAAAAALALAWRDAGRRRRQGSFWWRIVPAPLSSAAAVERCWASLWDLVRGVTHLKQPSRAELARRYVEFLSENIGQPGFRELLIAAHDLDAQRDVVFALVAEQRRRGLVKRPTARESDGRRAEVVDLNGPAGDHLPDAVAAALAVPFATDPRHVTFSPEGYWRGEVHRLCDRPASVLRLLDELLHLDVQQIVLVSAAADPPGPHALVPPRLDPRGRAGEYLSAFESAAVEDAARACRYSGCAVYVIRPAHNPVGPFDFASGFDTRSDRPLGLAELMARGYEDAYHQFIEPVVGASGERVGRSVSRRK